ncbi:MAG TPA: carbon-nitrogen hydrolase family protein [Planctomycetota bacterium]|nr:carbon-nitrogen hydrolase family protein [Planctomycetota bacterium]
MEQPVTVALVSDVFFDRDAEARLCSRLGEAKGKGAALAVLPEIPLNPWSPATKEARADDAEPAGGPRAQMLARCAKKVGIAVLGGAIIKEGGKRLNTALLVDAKGELVGRYAKTHLPEEPGFWETSHYEPGDEPPRVMSVAGLRVGVQICSDSNRPALTHALACAGAEAILAPRATERDTWESWKLVFRANALTTSTYVLSVNRPAPEQGCPLGGPSFVADPMGNVLVESTDPVVVATLDPAALAAARRDYPGYLARRSDLYARAFAACASRT